METNKTIVYLSHYDGNLYLFRLPIMEAMKNRGYRVIALVPSGEYNEALKNSGIEVINYEIVRESINPLKELFTIHRIYKKIKEINPEILHTFTAKPNLYGAIAGKFAGVKKIFITVTGLGSFFIDTTIRSRLIRSIIISWYKIASKIATKTLFQNSDDLGFFVESNITKKDKTILIGSSGIDTNVWQKTTKNNLEIVNILFVGRVIAHKGIIELLTAYFNLLERYNNIHLTIVGDIDSGNHFALDSELLEEMKSSENITITDWQKETKKYYENSDIFVLPSYREGVPRTVIEAMSMSLAIITTDSVGCRDTITHEKSGFLVPVKDAKALEEALEKLIIDKELREKFGAEARIEAVQNHDINIVINRYLDLYNAN